LQWLSEILGGGTASAPVPDATLPERVRAAIRSQQDRSEILIGWIQLAVVLTFGTLYAVSPKTFMMNVKIQPVPWALGAYFFFTVLRLGLAYRWRLPAWFLILSIVIDIGLLYGLMWSFHLQYRQPASFILKEPTLLYVFIFIALRALRFEARYVLIAGGVAAAGWLLMVLYVVTDVKGDPMITHNYVEYLTSNSVLVGAEFDKVVSILTVTIVVAVALARARRLLVRAVAEGTAARELSRFFAPEVARSITRAEQQVRPGQGVIRDAAIMNVDIRGFTGLAAEVSADELMKLLNEYQSRLVPLIRDHNGSIDKFLGDGILASFGAVRPSASCAADALRAVEAVMAAAEAWSVERRAAGATPLSINAAVATGRIIHGAVGDASRLEYTVIGDAVNLSAKLEKHAKVEKVRALATREAYEAALAQGLAPAAPCEHRAGRAVAGVELPLDLVVLAP